MGKRPPKWLPGERVNETILTQRKSVEQLRADRALRKDTLKDQRSRLKAKTDAKRQRRLATKKFLPAQAILKQAIRAEKQATGFWKRSEKFTTRLERKSEEAVTQQYKNAPIALVIRTAGNQIPPEVKSAFAKFGLEKLYKGRLVHLNPANDRLTKQLKSFSTIGFPTTQQLEQLIRTRGCFWNPETKSKSFINGNLQVEQYLAPFNVLTIEELVDAVVSKSEHVDRILSTLAPFDLHPPRKLFIERHRSGHEKLEIANPASFEKYLERQLVQTAVERKASKLTARKATRKETTPGAGRKSAGTKRKAPES